MPLTRLTTSFIRNAVCPLARAKIDYFDTEQSGFLVEVRRSGGRTFYQRYTDERGRKRQYKLGAADVLPLRIAKKLGKSIVAQSIAGSDPYLRKTQVRSIPSVQEFLLGRYLPHVRSYKRSWNTDETIIRIHVMPTLGRLFLDEVDDRMILSIIERMRSQGYAGGTTNRVVIVLRHAYNLARKWKVLNATCNPTDGIALAPDVCRQRFLSAEELVALIRSLEADENKVAAQAILLLLLTGARRNEITHAKWDEIDWDNCVLTVPLSKSGRPRVIALSSQSMDVLRSIPRGVGNPYIFPSPITGRPSASLHFPWFRIRSRAGLANLRLHDLRHSFASFLVNDGVSLYTVQGLLGHSATRYTQRYSHLTSTTLNAAAEKVAELIRRVR